jgi:hypothetical protein
MHSSQAKKRVFIEENAIPENKVLGHSTAFEQVPELKRLTQKALC